MYSKLISGIFNGFTGMTVTIETHITCGLPYHIVVGLASMTIKESKERVRSAIKSIQEIYPDDRISQNLYPANEKKQGAQLDLALAAGIICAVHELDYSHYVFLGELSLSGEISRISNVIAIIDDLKQCGYRRFILPIDNMDEANHISDIELYPFSHLKPLVDALVQHQLSDHCCHSQFPIEEDLGSYPVDLSDVVGQFRAVRAMTIAAAGHHSMLLIGPPGCGKSMLAERFITILPDLTHDERIVLTKLIGTYDGSQTSLMSERPVRAPHHSCSKIALVGGGHPPKAGEVTKAHLGVLILDELGEFQRAAIESLREPLSSKNVQISRGNKSVTLPSDFYLLATMNPCNCGKLLSQDGVHFCRCTDADIRKYYRKLSWPMIDRIEMTLSIPMISTMSQQRITSKEVKEDVAQAKKFLENVSITMSDEVSQKLKIRHQKQHDTMRKITAIQSIARTIAALDHSEIITMPHLIEAMSYDDLDHIMEAHVK